MFRKKVWIIEIERVHPELRAVARKAPRANVDNRAARFLIRLGRPRKWLAAALKV
jgi:hypothetical protein